ncbi:MAG: MFS transporter [Candidatus Competibacterales bacterium]
MSSPSNVDVAATVDIPDTPATRAWIRKTFLAILYRSITIATISFLTLINLFGAQALLPSLVETFQVSPAAMGFAVNASTLGMALASAFVALFSRYFDQKRGVWLSLALLSVPTLLLGFTTDLTTFAILRVIQGMFMATAFALTMTHLSMVCSVTAISGALAAYITGNVASNLLGRIMAAGLADHVGLAETFYVFAALNLLGAVLAYGYIGASSEPRDPHEPRGLSLDAWRAHLANPALQAAFAIGFLLLLIFIATFTYVNFVLAAPPFALDQTTLGLVYLVFIPALITTPLAGNAVHSLGPQRAFWWAMGVTGVGLVALLVPLLVVVLLGLAVVGAGTFFAQAAVTGFVGRAAGPPPPPGPGFLTKTE